MENWKTSVGFSILGVFSYLAFWLVLVFLSIYFITVYIGGPISGSIAGSLAGPIAGVVSYTLGLVYAIGIYPSYFKEKPILKSNKAISFFNFFFGNVICGPLWNRNLTKSRESGRINRGSSHVVWAVICSLSILTVGFQIFTVTLPQMDYVKSYYEQQTSSSQLSQGSQSKQQDESSVFSINFPAEPNYKTSTETGHLIEFYTAEADGCLVYIEVERVSVDFEGEDPYDLADDLTYVFLKDLVNTDITERDIEKGTFDGRPAGYISLEDQKSKTYIFCSTIIDEDYVLNILIKADANSKIEPVITSLALK